MTYVCTRCGAEARACHHSHGFTITLSTPALGMCTSGEIGLRLRGYLLLAANARFGGDDGIQHSTPEAQAAARENIADAVGAAVSDTLRPAEYLLDHGVCLGGRSPLWLFRWESADDFAMGEDRRKAVAFTKAAAEQVAAILGKEWKAARL